MQLKRNFQKRGCGQGCHTEHFGDLIQSSFDGMMKVEAQKEATLEWVGSEGKGRDSKYGLFF